MPKVKCPKCVSFGECCCRRINSKDRYTFICRECGYVEEKIKRFNPPNLETKCPFCNKICKEHLGTVKP